MKKRALISVSDKTNLLSFVRDLVSLDYEIISTGGTKQYLDNNGIETIAIESVTNFNEMLDGRVKTLHPKIHGGLLAIRDNVEHLAQVKANGIEFIDLVVVNLYPFAKTINREGFTHTEAIENIDIGGPSMLRSAAKNHQYVGVVCDLNDYELISNELKQGELSLKTKQYLAAKAFSHTAQYDSLIANYLLTTFDEASNNLHLNYELKQALRYGENPHQSAKFYKSAKAYCYSIANSKQLHGKELSYNNIQDANAALMIAREFHQEKVVVALKHMNPCGVGVGTNLLEAWTKAYNSDPISIFGGIICTNQEVTKEVAELMSKIFLEIIIAPSFSEEALSILTKKANIRLILADFTSDKIEANNLVSVNGGLLVQSSDTFDTNNYELNTPTKVHATTEQLADLIFANKVVKHVKSNAIVIAKDGQTIGIGAGQMNRVGSVKIALAQAGELAQGAVLASDAFFPMNDSVSVAIEAGISAFIQPGGSIKDSDSIAVCDEYQTPMVFTKVRHFKH